MSKSDIAVSVRGVSKSYTIAHNQEKERDLTVAMLKRLRNPFHRPPTETFWALKDINFDIKKGDVVGIIGRNGAGKSTLLKILSRITEPTTGKIDLYGRIGSLLEVGTGFHPELTGRENVYLNGAILGMTKREITKQFDAIVDFAGIEQFLDTPVKRYSSGMYIRLAFAVASHLRSEILIVDEVLAVGDAEFQKKCLGRMHDVAGDGRTVIFVSHNVAAILALTNQSVWLRSGKIESSGPSRIVANRYTASGLSHSGQRVDLCDIPRHTVALSTARLTAIDWLTHTSLRHACNANVRIEFSTTGAIPDIRAGIGFGTAEGVRILTYNSDGAGGTTHDVMRAGHYFLDVDFGLLPLNPGLYTIDVGLKTGEEGALDYVPCAAFVEVGVGESTPPHFLGKESAVRITGRWKLVVNEYRAGNPGVSV